jgi:hypothetical protein
VPEEQQAKAPPAEEQHPETGRQRDEDRDGDRGGGGRIEVGGAVTLTSAVLVGVGGVYATTQSGWLPKSASATRHSGHSILLHVTSRHC